MTTQSFPGWGGYAYSRMRQTPNVGLVNSQWKGQPVSGGGVRAMSQMGPQTSGASGYQSVDDTPPPATGPGSNPSGGYADPGYPGYVSRPTNPGLANPTPLYDGGGTISAGSNPFGYMPFAGFGSPSVYPTSWTNIPGIGWTPHAQPVTGSFSTATGYNPFGGSAAGGFSALGFNGMVTAGVNSGMSYADARSAATDAQGGSGQTHHQKRKF